MITASYLYAKEAYIPGNNNCFYCGLDCGEQYIVRKYVKKTFTNLDIVKYPGSKYVCGCCVKSMAGKAENILLDGEERSGVSGAPRMSSWVLTDKNKWAGNKKHLYFFRNKILNPPAPPFSIILADSGKKQLIFRGVVNYDRENFVIMLEEDYITVCLPVFKEYLEIAKYICQFIGKIALQEPETFLTCKTIVDCKVDISIFNKWLGFYSSPLGRLISWICPNKEDCRNEFTKC